jgi:ribosomal protein L11 methyltransferase
VKEELEELKSFMDIGECTIESEQLQDTDYINNWKEYFHQFYVDDILITPSWEEVKSEDEGKMIIHIDPGTAFGTGMHETTQLCIRELRKYVNSDTRLLDVGTGSGILSIMAYKFGAGEAVGTDLDPCTIEAVQDNMENNGLSEAGFKLIIGNIIDSKEIQDEVGYEGYDIVTANILAEVLLPLTPVITRHIKPGGIYITSGIIEDKEQTVTEAVRAAGFEIIEVNHQGEWVSVTARRV